ncbi:MAG: twin-arginine translocase subunit TatC [Acidobacteriota bacterium]|nr:twin-arginine translocase subunit TatC [Acidobacteriota bacterium]
MSSPDDQKGEHTPLGGSVSPEEHAHVSYEQVTDNSSSYNYYDETGNYGSSNQPGLPPTAVTLTPPLPSSPPPSGAGTGGKKPPEPPPDEEDQEEDGMLRMSFLGHLEELRKRIFLMLIGIAVAFTISLTFCSELWVIVSAPAKAALTSLGVNPPNLAQIEPMEAFNVIWFKLPSLVAIFLSSPWILYQVWAFIAPGLYKKERRMAGPFVISSAGLFILGGLFAYFVAFRYGLTFLLGIGHGIGVTPLISINEYFALFVNVTLGIGVVFELPVLIFLLTLLRVVSPGFLIRHSRYAILGIVILAAVITPTPDIFNLMLFATPMCLLFYVGIFASYLLVLKREGRRLPWKLVIFIILAVALLLAAVGYFAFVHYHFRTIPHWPFLTQ